MYEALTEEIINDIIDVVADGAETNNEIASALGWTQNKFENWKYGRRANGKEESAKIAKAINDGLIKRRKIFKDKAENALKRVIEGYEYKETTLTVGTNGSSEKTVTKYAKPDTTAIIFSLKEYTKDDNVGLTKKQLEKLSPELLDMIATELENANND